MLPILGWLMGPVWAGGPEKFAGEVDGLVQRGQPAPGHVLLVGSSTMRLWKTAAADLAPLPIENRGFGGSHTEDQLFYFDRLMAGLEPAVVVWYCGSNDVNAGKEPERILRETREWLDKFRQIHPAVPVVLVTVMRGPQKKRDHRIEAVDAVNRGYLQIIREFHGVTEADINPVLEHAPGDPRKEYYRSDGLHLNERGYAEMVKVVRPRVEEAYREFKKREEEGGR